jgi:hypothetical protein
MYRVKTFAPPTALMRPLEIKPVGMIVKQVSIECLSVPLHFLPSDVLVICSLTHLLLTRSNDTVNFLISIISSTSHMYRILSWNLHFLYETLGGCVHKTC